ncbi:DEAD/DEAH box helicase [Metallosphaera sedula]|uniref:DEAD/DEAH box helicase n=1 Tax=Metallosphaera sedula TaxID=43687 RepID=UPI0020C00DD2|nr:DEAD/DEAH box helicase [Metallosphaera sedula]
MSLPSLSAQDLFSDYCSELYQEILKHELCLIRFNDLCMKVNDRHYVPASKYNVVHDFDATLTILDLAYLFHTYHKPGSCGAKDLDSLINILKSSRLLIDLPCHDDTLDTVLKSLDNPVMEINIESSNVFRYFKMLEEIQQMKGGDEMRRVIKMVKERKGECYKTAYGELLRLYRYEGALPSSALNLKSPYYVLEAYLLPFIEEYIPNNTHNVDSICDQETSIVCESLRFEGVEKLNSYQFEMIKKLKEEINKPKLGIISAPTGSGKTYVFSVYLLMKLLRVGGVGLVIYPTKTLAREQLEKFIKIVYYINKHSQKKIHLYILDGSSRSSKDSNKSEDFRGGLELDIEGSKLQLRYKEGKLVLVGQNDIIVEEVDWLSDNKNVERIEEPAIVISNHSMISNHLDRSVGRNHWIENLLDNLNTLIIDEAHTFLNSKDLSDFMHFLILRIFLYLALKHATQSEDIGKAFKEVISSKSFDILISSATMETRDILEENVLTTQLAGIDLLSAPKANSSPPDLSAIFRGPLGDLYQEPICIPYYSTFDRKDSKRKLVVTSMFFPSPSSSSTTHFIEALSTSLLWSLGLGSTIRKLTNKTYEPHILAFIDSKETQGEVFRNFVGRGLSEEEFHKDKLFIENKTTKRTYSKEIISTLKKAAANNIGNMRSDDYNTFMRYSHLQFFMNIDEINAFLQGKLNQEKISFIEGLTDDVTQASKGNNGQSFIKGHSGHFVVKHNADLEARNKIESILSQGKWNICLSTSTLEMGVNLGNVNVVMQLGKPSSSDSYIQRLGRGGRNNLSFRISFGAIFLKNFGEDISYLDEGRAFRDLFSIEMKNFGQDFDEETLTRYGVLLYKLLRKLVPGSEQAVLEDLIRKYKKEPNEIISIIKEINSNKEELKSELRKYIGTNDTEVENFGLHSLAYLNMELTEPLSRIERRIEHSASKQKDEDLWKKLDSIIEKLEDYIKTNNLEILMSQDFISFYGNIRDILQKIRKDKKYSDLTNSVDKAEKILGNILGVNLFDDIIHSKNQESNTELEDRIDYFLLGGRVPHPAIISDIQGIRLDIDVIRVVPSKDNKAPIFTIIVQGEPRISRKNRGDLIKTVPLKYYRW